MGKTLKKKINNKTFMIHVFRKWKQNTENHDKELPKPTSKPWADTHPSDEELPDLPWNLQ